MNEAYKIQILISDYWKKMTTMKQSGRGTGVKMVQRLHTRKAMMMMK